MKPETQTNGQIPEKLLESGKSSKIIVARIGQQEVAEEEIESEC